MSTIAPISSGFVTRPQTPPGTARPATQGPARSEAQPAPTREPDALTLTPAAIAARASEEVGTTGRVQPVEPVERAETDGTQDELTPEQREQVEKLKARDAEVKAHEQAHVAAAGPYFRGGPTYSYQEGPDGNRYAVGGSVQIDTSPVSGDPEATIAKAQVVKRAALAPAKPSSTDQQVAAAASRMEAEARRELAEQQADDEQDPSVKESGTPDGTTPTSDPDDTDPTLSTTAAGQPKNDEGEPIGSVLDLLA
ncbi:MAG: hypothetical protein Tsb0013_05860 [Phycisphaerales bacterium]